MPGTLVRNQLRPPRPLSIHQLPFRHPLPPEHQTPNGTGRTAVPPEREKLNWRRSSTRRLHCGGESKNLLLSPLLHGHDRDRRKPWRACQSGFVLPLERTPSAVCPAGVLRGRIRTKRDSVFCWCPPPLEFLATRSSSGPQGVESETSQLRAPPSSPGTQSVCRAQWSSSSEWQQEQQRTHEIYSCLPPSGTWGRRILPRGVSRQMRRLIDGIGSSCSHPPPLCGPITPGG